MVRFTVYKVALTSGQTQWIATLGQFSYASFLEEI